MASSRYSRKKRQDNCKHCDKEFTSTKVSEYKWTEHCEECVEKKVWINRG